MTTIRLGVFYDGGWFNRLWLYMAHDSKWQSGLAFRGVHGVLRWYVHRELGHPLEAISLGEAHYVLGRPPGLTPEDARVGRWIPVGSSQTWDQILDKEGITRHDTYLAPRPGSVKSVGADVTLALVTADRALSARLDIVVLVASDGHMVPLVRYLRERNITVIVPSIDSFATTLEGVLRPIKTEPALMQEADHAPPWDELVGAGLTDDYPLMFPFVSKIGGAPNVGGPPAKDGYHYGTINNWKGGRGGFGFITANDGTKWYVSAEDLVDCDDLELQVDQSVRFSGRPRPQPGRPYPQARSCRRWDPANAASDSP
ncbi:NYN domain-containing protein [Nonomuraea endophytica]|uniref:NYN domain-containing protein n=1 Tax=Nonomuraea endophytica TaxID=714136 RepID=UPI0037CC6A0B